MVEWIRWLKKNVYKICECSAWCQYVVSVFGVLFCSLYPDAPLPLYRGKRRTLLSYGPALKTQAAKRPPCLCQNWLLQISLEVVSETMLWDVWQPQFHTGHENSSLIWKYILQEIFGLSSAILAQSSQSVLNNFLLQKTIWDHEDRVNLLATILLALTVMLCFEWTVHVGKFLHPSLFSHHPPGWMGFRLPEASAGNKKLDTKDGHGACLKWQDGSTTFIESKHALKIKKMPTCCTCRPSCSCRSTTHCHPGVVCTPPGGNLFAFRCTPRQRLRKM